MPRIFNRLSTLAMYRLAARMTEPSELLPERQPMRCAVLVPEWTVEQIFLSAFARSMGSYQEPSGPLYVAAALLQAGHEVVFADGALRSNQEILRHVAPQRPDFVGIYVCAPLWPSAKELLAALRRELPAATLAIGGPWAVVTPRQCLEESPDLDLVFTCEGEEATPEVLQALLAGDELADIPGLAFRGPDGQIVDTGYRQPNCDLDSLPFPARELLGDDIQRCTLPPGGYRAQPVAHLIGSRGCTNRCVYCFHLEREPGIRYRSPENIVDEMQVCIERFGFREIRFLDDCFAGDRQRVLDLCDLIEARGLRVPWYVSARIDTVDQELLRRMKRAGCWAILYGIETGVQKNMDAIGKGVDKEQVRRVVAWSRKAGIKMFTPFMFGLPGETFEEGLRTIDFAIELDPWYANFNTLTPFPGTWLWEHGDELGSMNRDPAGLTFQGGSFVPHSMSAEEIVQLRRTAFRRFYTRPRFALRWLTGIRNASDVATVAKGALSFAVMWARPDAFRKGSR